MTFFLEKCFSLDRDNSIKVWPYIDILIRPCNEQYDSLLEALLNKSNRGSFTLDPQIASFHTATGVGTCNFNRHLETSRFSSTEEWLIWLALYAKIVPDFEYHIIRTTEFTDYAVKIIDLHTKTVVYDNTTSTVQKIWQQELTN